MDTREASSPDDQRIQGILAYFNDNIDKSKASDFLHSLLVSHDILTWNFCGQIVYLSKTIPNKNIVDQWEYCLSPNGVNIPEPPGLNVFVKGLPQSKSTRSLLRMHRFYPGFILDPLEGEEESDNDDSEEEMDDEEKESEQSENERDPR